MFSGELGPGYVLEGGEDFGEAEVQMFGGVDEKACICEFRMM